MATKRSRTDSPSDDAKRENAKKKPATFSEMVAQTELPADVCAKLDEEHTCSISQEIPIDPVLASDGMTYERHNIEAHIERLTESGTKLTSPLTRETIAKDLKPNRNLRNLCDLLIKGGYWVGEKAESWLARKRAAEKNEAKLKAMEERAKAGDIDAAYKLGQAHCLGTYGLRKNDKEAYKWYKVGAENGDAFGACAVGMAYIHGDHGFEKSLAQGMAWIQTGAVLGSECACYEMGHAYRNGLRNFPVNRAEAAKWFRRMSKCPCQDAEKFDRRKHAEEFLKDFD